MPPDMPNGDGDEDLDMEMLNENINDCSKTPGAF